MNNQPHISWPEHYPEQLADIGNIIATCIAEHGIARDRVGPVAFEIVERIRHECGGTALYLARGKQYELTQREEQIWREFNGTNYYQLAKKYERTENQIRNIVKRARARDQAKRQNDMFAGSSEQN
jgi:Mor family transcriptional regulator